MNWLIAFVIGVLIGQEVQDAPRIRPYLTAGIKRLVELGKDVAKDAQTVTSSTGQSTSIINELREEEINPRKSFWGTRYR